MVLCFKPKLIDTIYRRPRKIENCPQEGEKELKKNSALHLVAILISRILPAKKPAFHKMNDDDFITILSWLEDWEPEKVYKTAYKESHIDYIQTWDEWAVDMQPLPIVVRTELETAMKIHDEAGNLKAIRAYSFFFNNTHKLFIYPGLFILFLWILF